ncbi:MAG: hypothetical protein HQM13_16950 [SAR324 cluster bacterium]|nr:hypothetical protein [SAR324 cluster bacterium]
MAKKAKKQKAGMLKRKQQKQNKKALQRRQGASRAPQQPSSEKEVQKILEKIPILAYEEELNEVRFDPETMRAYQDSEESEPDVLEKLITPEIIADCRERLEKMDERTKGDMQKNLMAKGAAYTLGEQTMPVEINPLIVAIYLRSKADLTGEPLALSQIISAVGKYEADNTEYIEKQLETITGNLQNPEELPDEDLEDEDYSSDVIAGTVEKATIDQELMDRYYQTLGELEEEDAERMKDDLEEFTDNYVTRPMEEWDAEMVDDFLGNWFIKNLNPLLEDLISMQNTLEHFFQFLGQESKIASEELNKITPLLQDKEKYKGRMT